MSDIFKNKKTPSDCKTPQELTFDGVNLGITFGNKIPVLKFLQPLINFIPSNVKLKLNTDGEYVWIEDNKNSKVPIGSSSSATLVLSEEQFTLTDSENSSITFVGNGLIQSRPKSVEVNGFPLLSSEYTINYVDKTITFNPTLKKTVGGSSDIYVTFKYYILA